MSFLHPWLLLGALAALVPLAVHLFDRRRPRPHPFAAISFVLRSQRRTASRLKLKRLLLYILRTLILLAIPIALARPELRKKGAASAAAKGPAATAIVIDGSLAMRFQSGQALFERAKDDARATLRSLLAEEPALVLVCRPEAQVATAPTFDRASVRNAIEDAHPSFGVAPLNGCLASAAHALEESTLAGKRIEVFSAFTTPTLQLTVPAPTVAGPKGERVRPEFVLHDAAHGKALPNHAIVDLKVEPAPQVGPRSFQFSFTVKNFSGEAVKDLAASLELNGQVVAKGFVDLPPNGAAQKALTHRFDAGGPVTGTLRISADGLTTDDVRSFAIQVPRDLKALVIDGAPNPVRTRDAAFFLEAALEAPGSPVRETVRDVSAGLHENFGDYDVVVLLDVAAPGKEDAQRLADFVAAGGGLLISMGNAVDPDAYNKSLEALLPRPLRLMKTAAAPGEPNADQRAARLAQVSMEHAIFQPFGGRAREGLLSARFYRYMLLEAERPGSPSQVLAAFDDGAPAVAIAERGKGRVLMFTSTLDLEWADLPIRTSYLPLVQRFTAWLAGALEEHREVHALVGQSVTLRPEAKETIARVRTPAGAELNVTRKPDGTIQVGPLPEPGLYQPLDGSGAPLGSLAFAVSLDPAASDTTRLKPEELAAYFGEEAVHGAGEANERKVPIWTWLLVAAALAFFLEGTLLQK
jgi:hypothetical protein